eukprot:g2764.t1
MMAAMIGPTFLRVSSRILLRRSAHLVSQAPGHAASSFVRGPRALTSFAPLHCHPARVGPANLAHARLFSDEKQEGEEAKGPEHPGWEAAAEAAAEGADDAASGADADADADAAAGDASAELGALRKELEAAQAEAAEHKDRTLRTLAEMENVRRISKRDVDNARDFAITKFAKGLLDVADNLERAIGSVEGGLEGVDAEAQPQLHTLLEGVQMTEAQLQKAFADHSLQRFGAEGDKFDPHEHDAMFETEDPEKEPGTIAHLFKAGYRLNDRVIRPAQVGTVKAAAK